MAQAHPVHGIVDPEIGTRVSAHLRVNHTAAADAAKRVALLVSLSAQRNIPVVTFVT